MLFGILLSSWYIWFQAHNQLYFLDAGVFIAQSFETLWPHTAYLNLINYVTF